MILEIYKIQFIIRNDEQILLHSFITTNRSLNTRSRHISMFQIIQKNEKLV